MDRLRLSTFLLSVFLLISPLTANSQTNPVENTTSGIGYEDISDAIQLASSGDVLTLSALTFTERLLIQKPLTIVGDAGGGTVIDVRGTSGWGVWLGSSGITMENVTILSDISHDGYGVHCDPGTTDLTLRNVRVLNNGASGIDLNGLVGPGINLIEDCEVLDAASGFGLALSSCQSTVVRNFTSSGNGFGDIGILESAYTSNRTGSLKFEGTMALSGPQSNGLGGVVIQSDTTVIDPGIGANFDIDMQAGLVHQLTGTTTYDGDPLGFVLCSPQNVSELSKSLSEDLGVADLRGKNLVSGETEVWPGMSLQVAVDAASEGELIRVINPGVYDTETVTVSKAMTILGPNAGIGTEDASRTSEAILEGGMVVNASNVTIDGIRVVAGAGKPFGISVASGVDNLEIRNTVIRGWYEEDGDLTTIGLQSLGNVELIDCSLRNWPVAVVMSGGALSMTRPIVKDNREGVRFDALNGSQDFLEIVDGDFRNAGADAFVVANTDADDALIVQGGTANLHRYAFRFDDECVFDITGGAYTQSEEQIIGLSTPQLIGLCEANSFSNPVITIDACDDPTAINYEECASENSGNCLFGGCTNPLACNYSETASEDDGSCDLASCAGCLNPIACNYDVTATIESSSCEFNSCRGCTDEGALNFEETALYDDGSCLFPGCTNPEADNYDASANFDNGVCFFYGCTDAEACNYDPTANVNLGTCEFTSCSGCLNPRACNYDATATIDDSDCDFTSCRGCTNPDAINYDSGATIDDGSCRVLGCTDSDAVNFNDNANYNDGTCIFGGCTDSGACNYDSTVSVNDGSCEYTSCAGCAIEGFCNYDPNVLIHDGSLCDYLTCCGDPAASNYDSAILPQLTFGCTYGQSAGMPFMAVCTLPFACNFGVDAACEFDSCAGCTDETACNYDPAATLSTTTCITPMDLFGDANVDCNGNCTNDTDTDGVCDEDEILGCLDETACNYDGNATENDGNCEYTSCLGCTDNNACNYTIGSSINDGSCDYTACAGCTDNTACNYDGTATISGACTFPIDIYGTDAVDCNGDCLADTDQDLVCDGDEVLGCTNSSACNYQSNATENDGNCEFTSCAGCMDNSSCNFDASATKPDDSCDYTSCAGCIDPTACNYVPTATLSTACEYPEQTYLGCDGECLTDTDGDGVCDPLEVGGCRDFSACNFSDAATDDDGSCEFTSCAGCTNPGACNFDASASINDGSCNYTSCQGCTDIQACNYVSGASTDDGSCVYVLDLYNVTNLDCSGTCLNDSDGDGICDEDELSACTDPDACNYEAAADFDDGSCEFSSCGGCLDPTACNYNPAAQFDDGSCSSPSSLYGKDYVNCFGICLNDADGDGICDEEEIGCTDITACNYDSGATTDDGSCTFPSETYLDCDGNCINDSDADGVCDELEVLGCENENACNYNPQATDDDGSCVYADTPCSTCNPDGTVNPNDDDGDGICNNEDVCSGDFNNDGVRTASDVLVVLAAYGCDNECGEADLDGNGFVTASDVLAMLSYFGTFCD